MTDSRTPENIPAHLVSEADQLTAMQAELGDSSLDLVVGALAEAALEGDDGSEEFRFPD
jgi:hypothetical protein